MSKWLIEKYRRGKKYNSFDARLHKDNKVMISLGDYSPFHGSIELNVWFDEEEFMDIYLRMNNIYNKLKNKK